MKRLKEQLQMYGANTLSTAELLAYLLAGRAAQKDPLALACKLLDTYGIGGLRNADQSLLCGEAGLSTAQAQRLKVLCELVQRFAVPDPGEYPRIYLPGDVVSLVGPQMRHLDHEELRVLVLDTKNRVVANVVRYTGTVNSSVLRASEVFRPAIVRNSPNIIVCHNHPSFDPTPSPEDLDVTRQLVAAGELLDIELLDHIIIGNPGFLSLKAHMGW